MSLDKKLDNILERYLNINKKLSDGKILDSNQIVRLNKEFSELLPIVEKINEYYKLKKEINDLDDLIKNEEDLLIKKEAEKEKIIIQKIIPDVQNKLFRLLIPKDIKDEKNVILEIRAGTGER